VIFGVPYIKLTLSILEVSLKRTTSSFRISLASKIKLCSNIISYIEVLSIFRELELTSIKGQTVICMLPTSAFTSQEQSVLMFLPAVRRYAVFKLYFLSGILIAARCGTMMLVNENTFLESDYENGR
jgi:hypothetical protein